MIKGIIFDFGGPILVGETGGIGIFEKHSLQRGLERDAIANVIKAYYKGAHEGKFHDLKDFFDKTAPEISITVTEINDIMKEMHSTLRIDIEMISFIAELKKSYKIALLTNFTSDLERFLKDVFNIHHLFDVVVNSYDIKIKKPNPEAYRYTLDQLKLQPEEAVFIDDKEENVLMAKTLGLKPILYKNFQQCKNDLKKILESKV
jgi:putative hydrolase of the HAD superfamily